MVCRMRARTLMPESDIEEIGLSISGHQRRAIDAGPSISNLSSPRIR
jgi:hypothetical protein